MKTIALSNGGKVLVDDEDYEWLSRWKWMRGTTGYAVRTTYLPPLGGKTRRRIVKMHREIMAAPARRIVDHINRNPFDNRRCNLRYATPTQNNGNRKLEKTNTSGFRGVYWHKVAKKWMASIGENGKSVYLGLHPTREDAARARDQYARKVFGEFAVLNLP